MLLLFLDRDAATKQCLAALKQWYETMIPALFPMMLLSSILVDTGFAVRIGKLCNRTLLRFLRITDSGCYCMLTGFLFGFPMGAKTTADMLQRKQISIKEAEYLLSFINCIGPMYTMNFIHQLFPQHPLWKLLTGIYGLPLLYGVLLRYILHRKETFPSSEPVACAKQSENTPKALTRGASKTLPISQNLSLPDALYECVPKCGRSILMLGGYMILFQVSFITLKHLLLSLNILTNVFYPLLEITGGFFKLPSSTSLTAVLCYTTFGGCCCLLQTYSFLKPAGLSIQNYALHKTILAVLALGLGILLA